MQFHSNFSSRSPVFGKRGVVASSQPLASEVGMRILQQGGNAADAAIAMAAALNVTQPCSTGIGGDCFAIFFNNKTKKVGGVNGSGRAPQNITIEKLRDLGITDEMPLFSPHSITVPGCVAGWIDTIENFGSGKLTLEQILNPAIELASSGFPVGVKTCHWWKNGETLLKKFPYGDDLLINGKAPKPGQIFKNTHLANTLKLIAKHGKDGFYKGPIAQEIVSIINSLGGFLTLDDLANHKSTMDEPVSVNYKGYDIFELPPNGQGLTALIALNILNSVDISKYPLGSKMHLHYLIEAMRLAFADTRAILCDPSHGKGMTPTVNELLNKKYGEVRRNLIFDEKANSEIKCGYPFSFSNTVYLSVVDGDGNACSFVNSNYTGFGSHIVPKNCGFSLHNRGANFSLDPSHPNCLAPLKRPYHTIISGMVLKDGELYSSFGNMGGFMQPTAHVQLMVDLIDYKMDPQSALDTPRFCISDGTHNGLVHFEDGIDKETINELKKMGHNVHSEPLVGVERSMFGNGQIIIKDNETGVLCAGSDNRCDGQAIAW